jgi:ADP-L-glycero-D-manno-heptose 6-epimerase
MHPSSSTRPVLVTGSAGFIGRHIIKRLDEIGLPCVGHDQRGGDIDLTTMLDGIGQGRYSAVVHLAAISDTMAMDGEELLNSNVQLSKAIAQSCMTSDTTLVYASSGAVYGRYDRDVRVSVGDEHVRSLCTGPLNAYGRSKLEFDDWMRSTKANFDWYGLRFSNVFGPDELSKGRMASMVFKFANEAINEGTIQVFEDTLDVSRDLISVEQVGSLILSLLTHNGRQKGIYNLGSGRPVTIRALLRLCTSAVPGARVQAVPNPVLSHYQRWTCLDMRETEQELEFKRPNEQAIHDAVRQLVDNLRPTGEK